MAPMNKKPSRSAVAKPVARKKPPQRQPELESDESDNDQIFPPLANGTSHHEIDDLQDIAERVGKEVDVFAETVDQLKDELYNRNSSREAAFRLCSNFREFAADEVSRLRKQHDVARTRHGRDAFTFSSAAPTYSSVRGSEEQEDLKRWQAEMDTWDLMCAVLKARYPSQQEIAARESKLRAIGLPHRYTSQDDLWQRFIAEDERAREAYLFLTWAEDAATGGSGQIELDGRGVRTGGVWTNGWMETRERIKGAKRMRFNKDGPIDVRSSTSTDLLVSSLDPDAPERERRGLEKADATSERSAWKTCFEMLRRGQPWNEISEWCEERNDGWRAVSMGVAAARGAAVGSAGPASGALWRKMCLVAARSGTPDEFEAAVFGLLGGDCEAVERVCREWNDHIFAHFNAVLKTSYDNHVLKSHPLGLSQDFTRKHGLGGGLDGEAPALSPRELIDKLNKTPKLSKEAQSPSKLLQGGLIGSSLNELCLQVGAAISDAAWKDEPSTVIRPVRRISQRRAQETSAVSLLAEDPNALRIISHLLIIMRVLAPSSFSSENSDELDNIIAGYIQLLRAVGKRDITPLYASLMASDRCIDSLAQVIADDDDPKDTLDFIRLMQAYDIDSIAVIKSQYEYQLGNALKARKSKIGFALLENTSVDLYPGRCIKMGGLSDTITLEENALINSLEVFYLVEGHWRTTFEALARVATNLLVANHFSAARKLIHDMRFEQLSHHKTAKILGTAINVMDAEHVRHVANTPALEYQITSLQRESQKYFDLTLLVRAVDALESWREIEHEFATRVPRPASVPQKVKKAAEDVTNHIEPLLTGILVNAADGKTVNPTAEQNAKAKANTEDEAKRFAQIRAIYLPEIILAYITVLCTAGHMVSRDELLTAMDLSTIIADKEQEQNGLAQAFLDAGRMKELVEIFARTGKIMLKLNESGKARREKKGNAGKTLAIWEING